MKQRESSHTTPAVGVNPRSMPEYCLLNQLEGALEVIPADNNKARQLTRQLKDDLKAKTFSGPKDPVLAMSLAVWRGRPVSRESHDSALHIVKMRLEDYQLALGPLLLSGLVASAEAEIQSEAFDSNAGLNVDDDFSEYVLRRSRTDSQQRFPTGIDALDYSLNGGLYGTTVMVGDKGRGKTAAAVSAVNATLTNDSQSGAVVWNLDMNKCDLIDRFVCHAAGVPTRELSIDDSVKESFSRSLRQRIRIVSPDLTLGPDNQDMQRIGKLNRNVQAIMTVVKEFARPAECRRLLFVVDTFQKIPVPDGTQPAGHDAYRLDLLQMLSKAFEAYFGFGNSALFIISEMRKSESSHRTGSLTMNDIKGDGRIASDADNLVLLSEQQRVNDDENIVTLEIAKGRNGVILGTHQLRFRHRISRFAPVVNTVAAAKSTSSSAPDIKPFED